MAKVLVIDDDRTVLRLVQKALAEAGVEIVSAENAGTGMERLVAERPDLVLLDITLPDASGIELVPRIHEFDPLLPVIFITVSEESGMAIDAISLGAFDFVIKPLGVEQVQDLVRRGLATRRLMQEPIAASEGDTSSGGSEALVGRSPTMLEIYKQIGRVASQDVSVLICGESGTGKELVARAIYRHSHRRDNSYLAVNCAALSDTLLESELFGHEKGAFTGADRRHIGKFEQCHGGTIFLDEIGDMSPRTQAKVLRLLQEQKFERVGGNEPITVDVRVISATNRDLERMIEQNEFRLDLYHRLNAFVIHLPPLRERGDDVLMLLERFISRFNRNTVRQISGVSDEALELLRRYHWPGNVRELQSVIRRAMLLATGPVLLPENFPDEVRNGTSSGNRTPLDYANTSDFPSFIDDREASGTNNLYAESLEWMERQLLTHVLQRHGGNQSKAAEQLGITRGSLRHKIRALGLMIHQVVSEPGAGEGNGALSR